MSSPHGQRVLRHLLFKSDIAHVKTFYALLLDLLMHPSNAALSDEEMSWNPDTQVFFISAETTATYPGVNVRFSTSDHLTHLTAKVVRGFRLRRGDNLLAFQRDILSWLSVLYRCYTPLSTTVSDHGLVEAEAVIVHAYTAVRYICPRNASHFFSCWMYVCRYFFANPNEPFLLPVSAPSYALRDSDFLAASLGYALGEVSSVAADVQPKNIERVLFGSETNPTPSYTSLSVCKSPTVEYPLEFLDGFVQEYVHTRYHGDVSSLGRRKAESDLTPVSKPKRSRVSRSLQFWRPPVFTDSDRASVVSLAAVYDSYQVLEFRDQYSRLFQRVLVQQVVATDGRFWQSMNESGCRSVTELSTLDQIGLALCQSPVSLTSLWFFFNVIRQTIELSFQSCCTTDLFWSYTAGVIRKFVRLSLSASPDPLSDSTRRVSISAWRIYIAAFAAWVGLSIDTTTRRFHLNRLFLHWIPFTNHLVNELNCRPSNVVETIELLQSAVLSPNSTRLLGVSLIPDAFTNFSIPLPTPRLIPLYIPPTPLPFASYLSRVERQNAATNAMLGGAISPSVHQSSSDAVE